MTEEKVRTTAGMKGMRVSPPCLGGGPQSKTKAK